MRCPKCGYISFDHLENCLKCNKDVKKASSQVVGTTYHVAAPSFLRFQPTGETSTEEDTEIQFDSGQEDFDVVDPDLNILVDEDEVAGDAEGISFDDDFGGLEELGDEEELEVSEAFNDDDDGMGIDLGQFEDAFEDDEPAVTDDEVQLDLPDELSDISDLSPPSDEDDMAAFSFDEPDDSSDLGSEANEDELGDFSLDLEEISDDFSLSSPDEGESQDDDMGLGDLSLDDIGLSSSPAEKPTGPKKGGSDSMDMDGDLDFDLDLDGLSLNDD